MKTYKIEFDDNNTNYIVINIDENFSQVKTIKSDELKLSFVFVENEDGVTTELVLDTKTIEMVKSNDKLFEDYIIQLLTYVKEEANKEFSTSFDKELKLVLDKKYFDESHIFLKENL